MKLVSVLLNAAVICVQLVRGEHEGCQAADHAHCDKLCKQDSFWYGVCQLHVADRFQCRCWRYQAPLDARAVCAPATHRHCDLKCRQMYGHEGYCYPHASPHAPRGVARCYCLPDKARRL